MCLPNIRVGAHNISLNTYVLPSRSNKNNFKCLQIYCSIVFILLELNLTLCNLYTLLSYFLKEYFIATTLSSVVAIKYSLRQYDKMCINYKELNSIQEG